MGFMDDVTLILDHCPAERQTLLFSATMPEPIMKIARHYMKDPKDVRISLNALTVETTAQIFYEVEHYQKFENLCRLIDAE
ncbi:MAG: DEAD/DEAH box helicase, partial [bacterium]